MKTPKQGLVDRLKLVKDGVAVMWPMTVFDQDIKISEATQMQTLDDEMVGFTRIGGGGTGVIEPFTIERAHEASLKLYQQDPLGRRMINLIGDFVAGDGIFVIADTEDDKNKEEIQDVIDTFWDDPINAMDRLNEQRVKEQQVWGEICMPVQVNGFGKVHLGWLNPSNIETVTPHPVTGFPWKIVLKNHSAERMGHKELKIIAWDMDRGILDGECFYSAINGLFGGHRGVPELYTVADLIKIMNNTVRAVADRVKLDSYFLWDVEMDGLSDDLCQEKAKEFAQTPITPNSIRVHNEKVKWTVVSPALGASDMATHVKMQLAAILGALGIPTHWYGSGDETNMATAQAMSEPTRKALKSKQNQTKYLIEDIIRFVLQEAQRAGGLRGIDLTKDQFKVVIPDLGGPDVAKVGAAMVQIVNATMVAEDRDWISSDTAQALFAAVSTLAGVEINPADEQKKVEGQVDKQTKADRDLLSREEQLRKELKDNFGGDPQETPVK